MLNKHTSITLHQMPLELIQQQHPLEYIQRHALHQQHLLKQVQVVDLVNVLRISQLIVTADKHTEVIL